MAPTFRAVVVGLSAQRWVENQGPNIARNGERPRSEPSKTSGLPGREKRKEVVERDAGDAVELGDGEAGKPGLEIGEEVVDGEGAGVVEVGGAGEAGGHSVDRASMQAGCSNESGEYEDGGRGGCFTEDQGRIKLAVERDRLVDGRPNMSIPDEYAHTRCEEPLSRAAPVVELQE